MSKSRIAVLGLAVGSAVIAAFLAKGFLAQPEEKTRVVEVNTIATADVLVAAEDILMGDKLNPGRLQWQSWPKENVQPYMITRESSPQGREGFAEALAKTPIFSGEPIIDKKLIKPGNSGFMAAVLPKGMRAISVRISEETGAGGFILPNDRVDVLVTKKLSSGTKSRTISEPVLTNVRVLAISQQFRQDKENGEQVALGKTATLELKPLQAEVLALAETTGQLTLTLRSLADNGDSKLGDDGPKLAPKYAHGGRGDEIKVLKYGIEKQSATSE